MKLPRLITLVEQNPVTAGIIAVAAVAMLALVIFTLGRTVRAVGALRKNVSDADLLTYLSASIATGVSAQGMWPRLESFGIPVWLRIGFFAFLEIMVLACAVRARASMRENHKAGVDGIAMWAFTLLSAILSATHAQSFPEVLFRLSAPLVAAWGWERSMKLERRRLTGRTGINWKLTPERILVRLGLAEPTERTTAEVDVQRRVTSLAIATKRARNARFFKIRARRRLDKALEHAVEYGGLGTDPASRDMLLTTLGALVNTDDLKALTPVAPWHTTPEPARAALEMTPRFIVDPATVPAWSPNGHIAENPPPLVPSPRPAADDRPPALSPRSATGQGHGMGPGHPKWDMGVELYRASKQGPGKPLSQRGLTELLDMRNRTLAKNIIDHVDSGTEDPNGSDGLSQAPGTPTTP